MNFRKIYIVCFFVLLMGSSCFAETFRDAERAYERGDFKLSFEILKSLVDQGDPQVQESLAYLYHVGKGTTRDDKAALKWYTAAAEQGYPSAQYNLGLMFDTGNGVPLDYESAMKWYKAAATQGYPVAQYNIGFMYHNGYGVVQDYVQAYAWYSVAGANGYSDGNDNRDFLGRRMTPWQIEQGQRLAKELWNTLGD